MPTPVTKHIHDIQHMDTFKSLDIYHEIFNLGHISTKLVEYYKRQAYENLHAKIS